MRKTVAIPVSAFKDGTVDNYGHKPMTQAEIAEREKMDADHEADILANGYKRARAKEYPVIGDQLDEIWRALEGIKNIPESTKEMIDAIKSVKEKNPKPGDQK